MKQNPIKPLDSARTFHISELFFSTTDRKGIVTGCNDVFTRIAAYKSQEILGEPHNIIRHPDMPRAVFKLLWDYLLEGRPIGAYVKNLAKTGEYYWVFALVMPCDGGFLSIRLKPSSDYFPIVSGLYQEILQYEKSFGSDWRTGMEESGKKMLQTIASLGFESYDDFMAQALHQEVSSRRQVLSQDEGHSISNNDAFSEVGALVELRKKLCETNRYFDKLGREISRVAVNASVVAARLSDGGRALGVISQEVSRVADQISAESQKLATEVDSLREILYSTSFMISFSTLLAEMKDFFHESSAEHALSEEEQIAAYGAPFEKLSKILDECFVVATEDCQRNIESLRKTLFKFKSFVETLSKIMLTLQLGYVTGKSISVTIPGGHEFALLLEDMVDCSSAAREELSSLEHSVQNVGALVYRWADAEELRSCVQ